MSELTGNGWDEYKRLVLEHLDRNEAQHRAIFERLDALSSAWASNCAFHSDKMESRFATKADLYPVRLIAYGLVAAGGAGLIAEIVIRILGAHR